MLDARGIKESWHKTKLLTKMPTYVTYPENSFVPLKELLTSCMFFLNLHFYLLVLFILVRVFSVWNNRNAIQLACGKN